MNELCKSRSCGNPCTKHFFNMETKSWQRCELVNQNSFFGDLAILPKKYTNITWESFGKEDPAVSIGKVVIKRFEEGINPKKSLIFSGTNYERKEMLSAMILKAAILKSLKASQTSLSILTDLYFSERKKYYEYGTFDVLCIEIGSEIANSSSPAIVMELFRERDMNSKYTFFLSKYALAEFTTKYSSEMKSFFSRDSFKETKVNV